MNDLPSSVLLVSMYVILGQGEVHKPHNSSSPVKTSFVPICKRENLNKPVWIMHVYCEQTKYNIPLLFP